MSVKNDVTFFFFFFFWGGGGGGGGGLSGACSAGKCVNYGSLKRHFLHFEDTLEQNIKVLNDIFLQRTSSFRTIISVQMKLVFHFAFYIILTRFEKN